MIKLSAFCLLAILLVGCGESKKEVVATSEEHSAPVQAEVAAKVTSTENTAVLRLEKMDCGGCAKKVKKALFQFPGIKAVQANPMTRLVYIEIGDKAQFDLDKAIAQIKDKAGYDSVKQ